MSTPALTTVHIDAEGHGRAAACTILGLTTDHLVHVPARIVVRESA